MDKDIETHFAIITSEGNGEKDKIAKDNAVAWFLADAVQSLRRIAKALEPDVKIKDTAKPTPPQSAGRKV